MLTDLSREPTAFQGHHLPLQRLFSLTEYYLKKEKNYTHPILLGAHLLCGRRLLFLFLRTHGIVSKDRRGSSPGRGGGLCLHQEHVSGRGLEPPRLPVISDELTLHKCYFLLILRSLCSYTCRHGKLRVWEGVWFC